MSQSNDPRLNDSNEDSREPAPLADHLQRFEKELARLSPRGDRLNRERLMFLAGQAAAGPAERPTVLGMNLESRAWPAAFAAMTAVAAVLLVKVITTPERALLQPSGAREFARIEFPHMTVGRDEGRIVLSPADARLEDVDELLAREDSADSFRDATLPTHEVSGARHLTPGRWQDVLNESESVGAPPKGASNHLHNRGATS